MNQKLITWDTFNNRILKSISVPGYYDRPISPGGRYVATGGGAGEEKSIYIYNAFDGKLLRKIGKNSAEYSLSVTRDGRALVGGESGVVKMWNIRSGELVEALGEAKTSPLIQLPPPIMKNIS